MTDLEKDCIQSWRKWLPEYTIKCWNEVNFDVSLSEFTKEAYRSNKYAFVSDVCRFQVLYSEGGIYLDTDMLLVQKLDSLLIYDFFIGEQKKGCFNAAIIGAEARHPIILELLNGYSQFAFEYNAPMDIPTYLNARLKRDEIKVFPVEYFYPLPYAKRGTHPQEYIQPETIGVHLWNHSWKNERDYLHDKNFGMALKQYFHRCSTSPRSIWKDAFLFHFIKFFLADKFGGIYRWYKKI
jgi:hypothetical protein